MNEQLKALLQWHRDNGCEYLCAESPENLLVDQPIPPDIPQTTGPDSPSRTLADGCHTLEQLFGAIRSFDGCEIKKSANSTVISDGNPKAKIMFVGEGPGANEDKEGIPFCGQSGKLLDNVIKSIGLNRDSVYITNTIFWRPPGNRRPTSEEISICRPLLEKHIALIAPQCIVLVGSTAVESLLSAQEPVSGLRQRLFSYNNIYLTEPIKTMVIYHPSYLLRQPYKKKEMWLDMQYLQQQLKG